MKQHDKLDAYIDERQSSGEFPIVDELFATAEELKASPALRLRIEQGAAQVQPRMRIPRVAVALAALVIVLAALMNVPSVRAFAGELLRSVFVVYESNPALEPTAMPPDNPPADSVAEGPIVLPDGQVVQPVTEAPTVSEGLSLAELQAEVANSLSYDLLVPAYLPPGYTYDTGMVSAFATWSSQIYMNEDRTSSLSLNLYDADQQNVVVSIPVGPEAGVRAVTVNGYPGEYAQGDYDLNGNWDATLPMQYLVWQQGDVLVVMNLHQQGGSLSLADMIAVAESLEH